MLAYGLAELPMAMAAFAMAILVPAFYVRDLDLPLATVGLVFILARAVDLLTDPLIGYLSDHTPGPWGRRKPWILAGAPVLLLAVMSLFTPRGPVTTTYLLVWTLVLWLGWTMVAIPYHAWGAELSHSYHQRTRITTWRTACSVIGVLLTVAAPLIAERLFEYGGNLEEGLTITAVLTVTLGVVSFTWLLARVAPARPLGARRVPLREGLHIMWRNGPFKRLTVGVALTGGGLAMAGSLLVLYVDEVIQSDLAISIWFLLFYAGNLLGVALWGRLARRIGKCHAWLWAMGMMVLCQPAFLLLTPGAEAAMVILLITAGVAAGSLVVLPSAMKADVVDVDRLYSGADRTGLYFSSWSMVQKAVVTWAMGLALLLLAAFDFAPSGPNGTAQIWALKVTFAGLPTLCYAAAILVIRRYPISEAHHRDVLRQLAARPN